MASTGTPAALNALLELAVRRPGTSVGATGHVPCLLNPLRPFGAATVLLVLILQTLLFLAISGCLVLAADGAAIHSTQKQRPAVS
jgi:hypothetical protein